MLTVHAFLNRGVSYVQGMNEIAGGVLEVSGRVVEILTLSVTPSRCVLYTRVAAVAL